MKKLLLLCSLALPLALVTACSSKTDTPTPAPAGPASGTVSYKLDGRATVGVGFIRLTPGTMTGTVTSVDNLVVYTSAQPAGPQGEAIQLYFKKNFGAPDSDYTAFVFHLDGLNSTGGYYDTPHIITLTKTATGGWSGTFAGTRVDYQNHPLSAVTEGVFTDLKP